MTLIVNTSTIYGHKGDNGLDITIKSGSKVFAPSWKIVIDHKNKLITDEEYT